MKTPTRNSGEAQLSQPKAFAHKTKMKYMQKLQVFTQIASTTNNKSCSSQNDQPSCMNKNN